VLRIIERGKIQSIDTLITIHTSIAEHQPRYPSVGSLEGANQAPAIVHNTFMDNVLCCTPFIINGLDFFHPTLEMALFSSCFTGLLGFAGMMMSPQEKINRWMEHRRVVLDSGRCVCPGRTSSCGNSNRQDEESSQEQQMTTRIGSEHDIGVVWVLLLV
jgi:hypothetical protein